MFTPRTLLRSKTMTLALIVSGLIAAFGISLVMLAFFGMCQSVERQPPVTKIITTHAVCNAVPTNGNVAQWVSHIDCVKQDSVPNAINASAQALTWHPSSEVLYNTKGILELELGQYGEAWKTLWKGRQNAQLTNGTLENNLAWSGLWLGIDSVELAPIYKSSLAREPNSCETIHTGMWVEYNIASDSVTGRRDRAIRNYDQLRRQYTPCATRNSGLPNSVFALEVMSAGVMDHEVKMIAETTRFGSSNHNTAPLFAVNAEQMMKRATALHSGSIRQSCREAMPNGKAVSSCIKLMGSSASKARNLNRKKVNLY